MAALTLDVHLENQQARVALDQTFHNPQDQTLEGVYKFALPPGAAVSRLAMYVDGRLHGVGGGRAHGGAADLRGHRLPAARSGAARADGREQGVDADLPAAAAPGQARGAGLHPAAGPHLRRSDADRAAARPRSAGRRAGDAGQGDGLRRAARSPRPATRSPCAPVGQDALVRYRASQSEARRLAGAAGAPAGAGGGLGVDDRRRPALRAHAGPADLPAARRRWAERPQKWVILDDTSASRGPDRAARPRPR
jgi:hypothetical protein